jgi:hypothetical protein
MLVGALEPAPPKIDPAKGQLVETPGWIDLGLRYRDYPLIYSAKIGLTVLAMLCVWPGYRQIPFQFSPLAWLVGLLGGAVWVGLCRLNLEQQIFAKAPFEALRSLGARPAYNPLDQLKDQPGWAYGFLAIRFVGLVLIVPIIEEFFLRGFVMRYVISPEWWEVGFDRFHKPALVIVTLYGVVTHPQEALAAAIWFTAISWLMLRTKSLWACVQAHAVTNLVVGVYVLASGDWRLM